MKDKGELRWNIILNIYFSLERCYNIVSGQKKKNDQRPNGK